MTTPPVAALRDLVPTLVPDLPQVIDEVVELLREEWPDYADMITEDPAVVHETAEAALHHLVGLAERVPTRGEQREADGPVGTGLFEELGRIEWREGRALATLLSAYRAGARVAWRHISRAALLRPVPPEAVARLAEAVFVFVEELSSASARGYVEEQLATSAERERLRAELVELLMSDRVDRAVVQATAARAGWTMPTSVSLVLVDPSRDSGHELLSRLETTSLPVRQPGLSGAVVVDPDAPGRRARLRDALRGLDAVVGAAVSPTLLPATVQVALIAGRLLREGVLDGDPLFVADHYDAILVHSDPRLLTLVTEQALSPLDGLPSVTRARLEETLTAWLSTMGDRQAVARLLHVHPQTVRYRVNRLRQLFGSSLDDPATRRRLMLALCWRAPVRQPNGR